MEGKTITPEVRAKLRKILALAEKGEAGEQATAKRLQIIKPIATMELKATDLRVLIRDKETGMMKSMPLGQIKISQFKPEQHEDGRYSFIAKVNVTQHINRRTRKQLRYLFRPIRAPKYIAKAMYVEWILRYDVTNSKSRDELMKMSHRELEWIVIPLAFAIAANEMSRVPEVNRTQIRLDMNTGEATVKLEQAKHIVEQLEHTQQ